MDDKSPQAFRTISEVSEMVGVPTHVLRFWESRFTQVKPVKRGGGRRYYRPEDVALLKAIHALLYTEGLTIRGVQKLLRETGPKQLIEHYGKPAKAADDFGGTGDLQADGDGDENGASLFDDLIGAEIADIAETAAPEAMAADAAPDLADSADDPQMPDRAQLRDLLGRLESLRARMAQDL